MADADAYGAPKVSDISSLVGSGIEEIFIKVEMKNYNKYTFNNVAFSNLTVEANMVAGAVSNSPEGFETELGNTIELPQLASLNFSVIAMPVSLTDRSVSAKIADENIARLIANMDGSYTVIGVSEGSTTLTLSSNLDPTFKKEIPVTVTGIEYSFADEYAVHVNDKGGNIKGGADSFKSGVSGGYGPSSSVEGDYLVYENIDFDQKFAGVGTGFLKTAMVYDATHQKNAVWQVYCDNLKEENIIATINVEPYGDSDDKQILYSKLSRRLTGKHNIYFVQTAAGSSFYNFAFGNHSTKYSEDVNHYYITREGYENVGEEYINNVVAVRGLATYDGTSFVTANTDYAGEMVYRIDAQEGKTLDEVDLQLSARNIKGTADGIGSVGVYISYNQQDWFALYASDKELNNIRVGSIDDYTDASTINLTNDICGPYIDGQSTVYVKISLKRYPKASVGWNNVSRVTIKSKSVAQQGDITGATDIAIITDGTEIKWDTTKAGTVNIKEGDTFTITATALPVTATDRTVKVASSDTACVGIQEQGNGKYTVAGFASGSAWITISTPSGVEKVVSVNVEAAPKYTYMTVSVNPNVNPNASIIDDGKIHPLNQVYCSWTGEEFGMGNTTKGDYAKLTNVDFDQFDTNGNKTVFKEGPPILFYLNVSNYSGETTDKHWKVYLDGYNPNGDNSANLLGEITVKPLNGWDYQQMISCKFSKEITGKHDIYIVCQDGGSLWSITFTNDPMYGVISYELPFSTNFASSDTVWLEHVVDGTMSNMAYNGALTASTVGKNYNKSNPVESYDDMEVNGTMVLRFDAVAGTKIEEAVLEYAGRAINSPSTDQWCKLPGKIEFYVSSDMTDWTKVSELCNATVKNPVSVPLAELTDGLETFYLRVDITRTSASFASWTNLTSLSINSKVTEGNVDFITSDPNAGITLPFDTDFSTNDYNKGVVAKSTQVALQYSIDSNDNKVYCLQPTSALEYEGVIMRFLPKDGEKIENLALRLNGRAIGGSVMAVYISEDNVEWESAYSISNSAISDIDYDALTLHVEKFDTPLDEVFVKILFYSTGQSFIDYSALTNLRVDYNMPDKVTENVPYNTTFSTGRTQIDSWLRKVVEMKGINITQSSSTISMGPVAGKTGEITMLYNSGDKSFKDLFVNLKGKAIGGSEIKISVSKDGKKFNDIAYINEHSNEYASSTTYRHEFDISDTANNSKNVWVKISLSAVGASGNCQITSFGITYDKAYVAPVEMPDRWQDFVFDTSMFEDDNLQNDKTENKNEDKIENNTEDETNNDNSGSENSNTQSDSQNSGEHPQTSDSSNPFVAIIVCIIALAILVGCKAYLGGFKFKKIN